MGHRRVIFRASQAEDLGLVSVFATAELCHACLLMCQAGLPLSLGTSPGTLLLLDVPGQALPSSCCFVTWNATSQRASRPSLPSRLCSHLTQPEGRLLSPFCFKSQLLSQMPFPPPALRFPSVLRYLWITLVCPSCLQYKLYRCLDRRSGTVVG